MNIRNVRYLKQKDHVSCGPVGLINVDKFFAGKLTGSDVARVGKQCKKNPRGGTACGHITQYIQARYTCTIRSGTNLASINTCLDRGGCVYMCYLAEDGDRHFSVITKRVGDQYFITNLWNDARGTYDHRWTSGTKLRKHLVRYANYHRTSTCWFITKRKL